MTNLKISLYVASKALLVTFVFLMLIVSIPETSVSFNNFRTQIFLRKIIPEGWAFFTRDPQETDYEFFKIKSGILQENQQFPHTTAANYFGLKRFPKLINSELFMILNEVDSTAFIKIKGCTPNEIAKLKRNFVRVKNPSRSKILVDSICVVLYKPIPWAWAGTLTLQNNNGQCAFLIVE